MTPIKYKRIKKLKKVKKKAPQTWQYIINAKTCLLKIYAISISENITKF